MRKYAHLKSPLKYDEDQFVYKIMLYKTQEELVREYAQSESKKVY